MNGAYIGGNITVTGFFLLVYFAESFTKGSC